MFPHVVILSSDIEPLLIQNLRQKYVSNSLSCKCHTCICFPRIAFLHTVYDMDRYIYIYIIYIYTHVCVLVWNFRLVFLKSGETLKWHTGRACDVWPELKIFRFPHAGPMIMIILRLNWVSVLLSYRHIHRESRENDDLGQWLTSGFRCTLFSDKANCLTSQSCSPWQSQSLVMNEEFVIMRMFFSFITLSCMPVFTI